MIATYIHNWDPVIIDFFGPLKLRWYGLSYLIAFLAGFLILRWMAKKNLWVLAQDKVGDFIAYGAFFGVFLGGRLGYIFFYQVPKTGWQSLLDDPLMIVRVWDGGMASHGGILGLMIFTLIYARKNKVSWTGVGDGLCVVGPLGVAFVRIANFINGELYGRAAQGYSWLMKFPQALFENGNAGSAVRDGAALAPGVLNVNGSHQQVSYLIEESRSNPKLLESLGNHLQARHPSQLYEAILEGLLIFAILLFLRIRFPFPKMPHGILAGLFFLLYAVFRIVVENFREPDSAMIAFLTKGQFYSLFMILVGLGFIFFSLWKKKANKEEKA